jgi:uncharacterized protein DUF4190
MTVSEPPIAPSSPGPSTQAITALVIGILGIVSCCVLLSPVAWYIGGQEIKAIREGRSPAEGEVLANVGRILGIVGTVLMVLFVLWVFFMGGLAVLAGLRSTS